MFQKTTLLLVFVALASCNNNANKNEKIKASQWLLGTWTQQSEQGILEETWKSVNDSTFEGTSYFIKGKDFIYFPLMNFGIFLGIMAILNLNSQISLKNGFGISTKL